MPKKLELVGKRFKRLMVNSFAYIKKGRTFWECKCDCGNIIIVVGKSLQSGMTRSCGCLQREIAGNLHRTHGHTTHRLFNIWMDIKKRCLNGNSWAYKYYGKKGITICKRWLKYENFYADLSPSYFQHLSIHGKNNTTIERIDNAKGYSVDNCTWATRREQSNHRDFVRQITYQGETLTVSEWAIRLGIKRKTLYCRIFFYRWPIADAFTQPLFTKKGSFKEKENLQCKLHV